MKNTIIIAVLVTAVLVLGYLFIKEKTKPVEFTPWPETEPATQTNNNFETKTYLGNGFRIDYPGDMVVHEEDAEGGPYRMIYFSRGGISISYVRDSAWFEQYNLAELELVGSQKINGNMFKIYNANESSVFWLKNGNTGYAININGLGDGDGLPGIDINTFYLINQNANNNQPDSVPSGYVRYSAEAPFNFTYDPDLFTPDYYMDGPEAYGSAGLSITANPSSGDGCDMVSILTKVSGSAPVCGIETSRYGEGQINYCKTTTGRVTGTTYMVNASTPQVCGKAASPVARSFVDHLISELSAQ